ncbi:MULTISPECIES: hypothetical protein [unclassified Flavobacterium]|uniref:hypothetical protein n=1 Tax=unclassified Flavobacterium TaxID=196869 RepID=UPI00057D909C|nr:MULTISPECIES: hypothetical protein [unclassified Flavobacterium]KIA94981.1 hypothetical protein OA93_18685 [Flavobacterium sp. KMS]OUL61511.1 hypothetical protein B8T70_14980 [Flavobacterium sp. AJR]
MVKKKINIILILIVLVLWGTVIYKSINGSFFFNETVLKRQNSNNDFVFHQVNKDTFELDKIKHDPFLNKQLLSGTTVDEKQNLGFPTTKKNRASIVPKPKPNITWPDLTYYGYIESKGRNEELVLLKIDSKLCRLKLNSPMNGLMVKKKYKDSIQVIFNSETKIIRLK